MLVAPAGTSPGAQEREGGENMQVRCPHCDEVEDYADDVAWRKTPCKSCNRGFTVTSKLVVGNGEEDGTPLTPPAPATARPARILGPFVVGTLLVGNALFARAWLLSRGRLEDAKELFQLDTNSDQLAAPTAKEFAGVKLTIELQAALIDDLNGKMKRVKRSLERAENALKREKKAHTEAKSTVRELRQENGQLGREMDGYAREVQRLERKLERRR